MGTHERYIAYLHTYIALQSNLTFLINGEHSAALQMYTPVSLTVRIKINENRKIRLQVFDAWCKMFDKCVIAQKKFFLHYPFLFLTR